MDFALYTLARCLHVAAIVGLIGGVWFVTMVVMPAIVRSEIPAARLAAFHRIEQGFATQAKFWVLLAGASGFWMNYQADMWSRFANPAFWWMHAMLALWTVFAAGPVMVCLAESLSTLRFVAEFPQNCGLLGRELGSSRQW